MNDVLPRDEQQDLRNSVKFIKVFKNATYAEIAEKASMNRYSFYNWVKGYYNLSDEKKKRVKQVVEEYLG